jgi:predicted transcriptional regulator YheO
MASREKALMDWVYKTCKGLTQEQLKIELIESKRLNIEILHELDKEVIFEIKKCYRSKAVAYLINLLGRL